MCAKRSEKWRLKARRKQSELLPSDLHAENAEAAAAADEEFDVDRLAGAVGGDDAQAPAPVRTKVLIVLLACIGGILLGSAASRYALLHRAENRTTMFTAIVEPSLAGANYSVNATRTLLPAAPPAVSPLEPYLPGAYHSVNDTRTLLPAASSPFAPPFPPPPFPPPFPPPAAQSEVGSEVLNLGRECLVPCLRLSLCPTFCGTGGACCRQGMNNESPECGATTLGCSNRHCCVAAVRSPPPSPPTIGISRDAPLSHGGQDCYSSCGLVAGACPGFCGAAGRCCRVGHDLDNLDCVDGRLGCRNSYCCVLHEPWPAAVRPPMPPRAAPSRCDRRCTEDAMGASRCSRHECGGCPDCPDALPHPLVVTAFVPLRRSSVKHTYDLARTVRIPAPYLVYCGGDACDEIREARQEIAVWGPTTIVTDYGTMSALIAFMAQEARVTPERLIRAAEHSTTPTFDGREHPNGGGHNCPSGDLILVWLAKTLLLRDAMRRFPEQQRFAWVDAGFNKYKTAAQVPPAPWLRFPETGAIAVRFYWNFQRGTGTCHNLERGKSFSHCIYGAWMYGQRRAWQTFIDHLLTRVNELVESQDTWIAQGRKMLCSDQDILTEAALAAPWMVQEVLPRNDWGWDATEITAPGAWMRSAEMNFPAGSG